MRRALIGLTLCACLALPAVAHADSVVFFSEPGDYAGLGQQRVFHSQAPGTTIDVSGDSSDLTIWFGDGSTVTGFSLEVAPPQGEQLHVGRYDDAVHAFNRPLGSPGLNLSGDGRGCNQVEGDFEVKDIAISSGGEVTRLWLSFEQHCEGNQPASFGEVRIGMPDAGPAQALPAAVRWPELNLGGAGEVVPIAIRASGGGSAEVQGVSIDGATAESFAIEQDDCTGVELAAGESCDVWVSFAPQEPGDHAATLSVEEVSGADLDVPLEGFVHGGTTLALLASEVDDPIGEGGSWVFGAWNSSIWITGNAQRVVFHVSAGGGSESWLGVFEAPPGQSLTPGVTYDGGFEVSGNSRGCQARDGRFEVSEAAFAPDGTVEYFGVGFVQRCTDFEGALYGTFEYRAPEGSAYPPEDEEETIPPPDDGKPTTVPPVERPRPGRLVRRPRVTAPTDPDPQGAPLTLRRSRVGRHGRSTHTVRVSGPGTISIEATAKRRDLRARARAGRRVLVASARRMVSKAGVYTVVLRPKRSLRAALQRGERLAVSVRVRFADGTGSAQSVKRKLVLRG